MSCRAILQIVWNGSFYTGERFHKGERFYTENFFIMYTFLCAFYREIDRILTGFESIF